VRALHLTYRFSRDPVGGAEHYMDQLSRALADSGVEVDLWTTRTKDLPTISRFGVRWDNARPRRGERLDGLGLLRYTTFNLPEALVRAFDRLLTARWRREERGATPGGTGHGGGYLGAGWYPAETHGALTMRWTEQRADFAIHEGAVSEISFEATCPLAMDGRVEVNGRPLGVFRTVEGWRRYRFEWDGGEVSNARIVLERTWRPASDPRRLGIAVKSLGYTAGGRANSIHLDDDAVHVLRRDRKAWIAHLTDRALSRPWLFEALFFLLRAPLAPAMLWDLAAHIKKYDVILAQMTPYSTLNYAVAFGARGGVPVVLLPHFHSDDDFYHLRHYYHAFRRSAAVLAFSPSQKAFFESLGARAEVVGGGGVDPAEFRSGDDSAGAFRQRLGLENTPLVLFVGRKAPSKRYDLLVQAVDFLNAHVACKLIMIGPDEDGQPIASANVVYLGRQERDVVVEAYRAADVFAMMSESESFGMVFLEAWMAGKPVIGNHACAAVADLIADGEDGFLCGDALECAEKIAQLILDPDLARRLGERGYDKAMREYTWDAIGDKVAAIYASVSAEARHDGRR
jgi:glycosyltransferase involved in cell wall biosynthesis